MPRSYEIFCRVIDHFGDVGVCWRLARRLQARGHRVRLWIDALPTLARLVPAVAATAPGAQTVHGVHIDHWAHASAARAPAGSVVIEAFGCTLPAAYQATLPGRAGLWLNLEYLSTESWVRGFHARASLQANGVPKYFWFPGFEAGTGGLLREDGLSARRAAAERTLRLERLRALTGLPTERWAPRTRVALVFAYSSQALAALDDALQASGPWQVLVADADAQARQLAATRGTVHPIDFVPQPAFDELLWCCALNCVRGEDSLVRALWAGAPFLWQLYPQDDGAQWTKLEAWLARMAWPEPVAALMRAWNRGDADGTANHVRALMAPGPWAAWQQRARQVCDALAMGPDLAEQLDAFCETQLQTR